MAARHSRRPSRQCRKRWRAPFAPEDAVRRARGRTPELLRRDPAHTTLDACLLEDSLGEVCPGAVAVRREVPDAGLGFGAQELVHGIRQVTHVRRAAALVVHDADLIAILGQSQHRPHEVVAGLPEEPGGADDPGFRSRGGLAEKLRAPVRGEWTRRVGLDVRRAVAPSNIKGAFAGGRRHCPCVPRLARPLVFRRAR